MTADISYLAAALGGLVSFLSPCVLPLVPAYLCFVAGTSLDRVLDQRMQQANLPGDLSRRMLLSALAFVLGFTVVFVALGASASAVHRLLVGHLDILARIAGAAIVLLGLHVMGVVRLPALNREMRFRPGARGGTLGGAFLVGLAFAFGWTPCIGPILGTILAIAAQDDRLVYGVSLLTTYSLGLGVPFVLAALGMRAFLSLSARLRRHMRVLELGTGALLVLTGTLIFVGSLQSLSYYLLDTFPLLARFG